MIGVGSARRAILDFARLGRPEFLVGGFVMHGLGIAMARYVGAPLDLRVALWGQLAITTTQLMTHYCNEYFDLAADQANPTPTRWAGGSRILVEGRVAPRVALASALVLGAISFAIALGVATLVRPGPLTFVMFVAPLFLAWSYSAPPIALHSRGLGEMTTALLVPGAATLIGFVLQTGRLEPLLLLVVLPLALLQFGMLLLIEVPDRIGDELVGKSTLVVRLGPARSARLYLTVLAMAYGLLLPAATSGVPPLVIAANALGLPIAAWLGWQMTRDAWADPCRWNLLSFAGIALLVGTAAADLIAFTLTPPLQ